jgi:hypothetical protein
VKAQFRAIELDAAEFLAKPVDLDQPQAQPASTSRRSFKSISMQALLSSGREVSGPPWSTKGTPRPGAEGRPPLSKLTLAQTLGNGSDAPILLKN